MSDSLVFERPENPGTHVLIVGVGRYLHGKGAGASPVGSDLPQLTSPPISARAMADWFIGSYRNSRKPLASVSMLISEENPTPYQPPGGGQPFVLPTASLQNVTDAAAAWANRLRSNKENVAVFYFCGHGASQGDKAALLLEDFGKPNGGEYEDAIDVDILRGTMKNSPAIQQLFLLDCCRTKVDDLYQNEPSLGGRVVSIPSLHRGHAVPPQQFILFPTIDGEKAFGIANDVSVFSRSLLDALTFAAADCSTGVWKTTTATVLNAVNLLVEHRLPPQQRSRSKPNALDATSFDFNELDQPLASRSLVTVSDLGVWGNVELECVDPAGARPKQTKHSRDATTETCCFFDLPEGRWQFTGSLPSQPPFIRGEERIVRVPVTLVRLEVVP